MIFDHMVIEFLDLVFLVWLISFFAANYISAWNVFFYRTLNFSFLCWCNGIAYGALV
jgi:hypothetical protein